MSVQLPNPLELSETDPGVFVRSFNELLAFVEAQHVTDPVRPTIIDVSQDLKHHETKTYKRRSVAQIEHIVYHHVGVAAPCTPAAIASYHVRHNDWPGAGYHYYIRSDGRIYLLNDIGVVSYHCGSRPSQITTNATAIGVCMEGSFVGHVMPPGSQTDAARCLNEWLLRLIQPESQLVNKIIGHKNVKQTVCPGDTWNRWRSRILPTT